MVKKANTAEELNRVMPDMTIIIDGTETPKQRPQDKEDRKDMYSGKKKRFTINTTIISNKNGLILGAGRSFHGGTHDLTMVTEDPVDFGRWSEGMYNSNTPEQNRIRVLADKGYLGITKHYKGIRLEMPRRRDAEKS